MVPMEKSSQAEVELEPGVQLEPLSEFERFTGEKIIVPGMAAMMTAYR
jgi:hypothetical protein